MVLIVYSLKRLVTFQPIDQVVQLPGSSFFVLVLIVFCLVRFICSIPYVLYQIVPELSYMPSQYARVLILLNILYEFVDTTALIKKQKNNKKSFKKGIIST